MSIRWVNPVTGYVEIDPVKFIRVFDAFKDDLSEMFSPKEGENKKRWERIKAWARDAKNIMDGTDEKKRECLSVHKDLAEWLNGTLGELSKTQDELSKTQDELSNKLLGVSDLRYDRDTDVRIVPDGGDRTRILRLRNLELENLGKLIQQCKANLQQKQSQSGQSNQKPDASVSTHATNSSTADSSPGFQYRKKWLEAFGTAMRSVVGLTDQLATETHLCPLVQKLRHHRFDRFIWPAVQYRRGTPTMARQANYLDDVNWKTVDTEDAVREEITSALANNQLVLMHDDAGMGKTAFSWMLFNHLLEENEKHPYVIRLEGIWPRSTDENKTPLHLMEVVLEELLGKRLMGRRIQSADASSDSEVGFQDALKKNNVFILLDGFDQMTKEDRAVALEEIKKTVSYLSEISNCHWLVSGRTFVFHDEKLTEMIGDQDILRLRLKRFDERRQDEYFKDISKWKFFQAQQEERRNPLDYMCAKWRKEATLNDLGIPLHLSEIRRVIEFSLRGDDDVSRESPNEIYSSSDLHARVSDVYLKRAIQHSKYLNAPNEPINEATKLELLRQICGCLAMQMMLDENYNASMDDTTSQLKTYIGNPRSNLVAVYLERSRNRYEQSKVSGKSYWDWGVSILQTIEVAHRGDIDVFTHECRSFRDKKAMEWYAAHYMVNHCDTKEWNDFSFNRNNQLISKFLGDINWNRCWQLAMEMPSGFYNESHLHEAIKFCFSRTQHYLVVRPSEWMWIAWRTRLDQDGLAKQRRIQALEKADEILADFRQEFEQLVKDKNPIAITLLFDEIRDRPNAQIDNPNQTGDGWYRRIPDRGEKSRFRGERKELVTLSQFWLRKFVVTNEEYLLFDQLHYSKWDQVNMPVTRINWYMAMMFCCWLGEGYRLPTEAEWETACRANELNNGLPLKETTYWFGDDRSLAKNHMWFKENSQSISRQLFNSIKVGGHENRFGLFDMSGNIEEWCYDRYGEYPIVALNNPTGPLEGSYRILRGGCWESEVSDCTSAARNFSNAGIRDGNVGFRVAFSSSGIPKSPEAEETSEAKES